MKPELLPVLNATFNDRIFRARTTVKYVARMDSVRTPYSTFSGLPASNNYLFPTSDHSFSFIHPPLLWSFEVPFSFFNLYAAAELQNWAHICLALTPSVSFLTFFASGCCSALFHYVISSLIYPHPPFPICELHGKSFFPSYIDLFTALQSLIKYLPPVFTHLTEHAS